MDVAQDPTADRSPLTYALDGFPTALDHLVKLMEDGALTGCNDAGRLAFLKGVGRARNRMALVDHRATTEARTRSPPDARARSR